MIQLEVPIQVSEGLPNGAFGGAYCARTFDYVPDLIPIPSSQDTSLQQ